MKSCRVPDCHSGKVPVGRSDGRRLSCVPERDRAVLPLRWHSREKDARRAPWGLRCVPCVTSSLILILPSVVWLLRRSEPHPETAALVLR